MQLKMAMLTNLWLRSAFVRLRSIRLVGGLLSLAVERAIPRSARLWVRLSSGLAAGMTIKVDPRFHVGYLRGDYETWVQDLLRRHLQPGDTYYDVGAHLGFFVLCAAALVGDLGRIVALEPDAQNFETLQANVQRNEVQGVTALQAAAWSSSGTVRFGSPEPTSGRSQGRVTETYSSTEERLVGGENAVRAMRLDDIDGPFPAVVKMDIEGAEVEACRGAERILAEQRTVWIIEAHTEAIAAELIEMLNQHGYHVTSTTPRHPLYGEYREKYIVAEPHSSVGDTQRN